MAKVIITGGTGLVGKKLSALLVSRGHAVNILTRSPEHPNEFQWNTEKGTIDERVFENATAIIHLAGAAVADKRWTDDRKKEIIDSRIKPVQLLYNYLSTQQHTISQFISASASGYYGDRADELLSEDASNGYGFLAEVCKVWEDAANKISGLNIQVAKLRIGIVLSKDGGALPKLALPVKFGIGSYIGSGKQFVPWIHIDDLCSIFLYVLEKNYADVFNACAPGITTNKGMSEMIAKVLHRPFIPVPVPEFAIKIALGEMASMVLMSDNCSSKKIIESGFEFRFPELEQALQDIYGT